MKKLIIILIPALYVSCRTVKDRRAEQQQRYATTREQSHKESSLYDSLHDHWYFATDSTFYFHPDIGLYAASGILGVVRDQKRNVLMSETADSLRFASESLLSERNVVSKKNIIYRMLLIMLAPLAVAFGFYLIRK